MPTVPRSPGAQVDVQPLRPAYMNPSMATGSALVLQQTISSVNRVIMDAALREKAKADEAKVSQAMADLRSHQTHISYDQSGRETGEPQGYLLRSGERAMGAAMVGISHWQEEYDNQFDQLANDTQRQTFKNRAMAMRTDYELSLKRHEKVERDKHYEAVFEADMARAVQQTATLTADPNQMARQVANIESLVDNHAKLMQWPEEQRLERKEAYRSQALVTAIKSLVKQGQVEKANDFAEDIKDEGKPETEGGPGTDWLRPLDRAEVDELLGDRTDLAEAERRKDELLAGLDPRDVKGWENVLRQVDDITEPKLQRMTRQGVMIWRAEQDDIRDRRVRQLLGKLGAQVDGGAHPLQLDPEEWQELGRSGQRQLWDDYFSRIGRGRRYDDDDRLFTDWDNPFMTDEERAKLRPDQLMDVQAPHTKGTRKRILNEYEHSLEVARGKARPKAPRTAAKVFADVARSEFGLKPDMKGYSKLQGILDGYVQDVMVRQDTDYLTKDEIDEAIAKTFLKAKRERFLGLGSEIEFLGLLTPEQIASGDWMIPTQEIEQIDPRIDDLIGRYLENAEEGLASDKEAVERFYFDYMTGDPDATRKFNAFLQEHALEEAQQYFSLMQHTYEQGMRIREPLQSLEIPPEMLDKLVAAARQEPGLKLNPGMPMDQQPWIQQTYVALRLYQLRKLKENFIPPEQIQEFQEANFGRGVPVPKWYHDVWRLKSIGLKEDDVMRTLLGIPTKDWVSRDLEDFAIEHGIAAAKSLAGAEANRLRERQQRLERAEEEERRRPRGPTGLRKGGPSAFQ